MKTYLIVCGLLVVLGCLAPGCGYTTHSSLNPNYQTIFVSAFKNQTSEYDLQAPLTNAVRRKFLADGRLRVVEQQNADLILEGTIIDYRLRGLTYGPNDDPTQLLCVITSNVRCLDGHTGEVLWEDRALSGETTFYTQAAGQSSDRLRGNAEVFLTSVRSFASEEENRGAAEALEQLASDILYRTIEPW